MKKRAAAQAIQASRQRYQWYKKGQAVINNKDMAAFCTDLENSPSKFANHVTAFIPDYRPHVPKK